MNYDELYFKYQNRMMKLCHNMLKEVEEKVNSMHPNLNIRTIIMDGRPSATIIYMAEKEGCDMIVMGTRGIEGIARWVLGSTSQSVAVSCKKHVIIIK